MDLQLISHIEKAAELGSQKLGIRPLLIIEGLSTRPLTLVEYMSDRGWEANPLERFGYSFHRNNYLIEVIFEPTATELAHGFAIYTLLKKGIISDIFEIKNFSLVESIIANDITLPDELKPTVEILKTLIIDQLGDNAKEWEMELLLNDQPQLFDIALNLGSNA